MNISYIEKAIEHERETKLRFAVEHGYWLEFSQNLWRVYRQSAVEGLDDTQVAMTTIKEFAIDVAFALAMVKAGAHL